MSLDQTTQTQLTELARSMLTNQLNVSSFENLGVLVRQDSDEFKKRENNIIAFGEIELDSIKFVYFAA